MTNKMVTILSERGFLDSLSEIWKSRELLYFLTCRHILVKYKQTVLGIMWSVLRPVLATIILVIVFNKFIGLESKNVPYPLIVISGFLLWNFFSNAVSSGATSLVSEQTLITRTYVPTIIIPLSALLGNIVEVFITLLLIVLMSLYMGVDMSLRIFLSPLIIIMVFLLAFAVSLFFTVMHAKYRDFSYIVPFFLQMGFYLSPVALSVDVIPENIQWLYYLNPFASLIECFRWCLFDDYKSFQPDLIIYPIILTLVLLCLSLRYFFKSEKNIADFI